MAPSSKPLSTSLQGAGSALSQAGSQAAAKEAAEKLAKMAAAKSAAKAAAKESAEAGAETAAKAVGKETAQAAAKEAGEEAAEKAAKGAAEQAAKSSLKESLQTTLASAKKSAGESLDSARASATKLARENPALMAGLAAAGVTGAVLLSQYQKSANTVRKITKIEEAESGQLFGDKKILRITFEPAVRITASDLITFKGTKTTPSIDDVDVEVKEVVSDAVILYKAKKELTDFTAGGDITVKTSFLAQAGDSAGETLGEAGGAAGNVAEGGMEGIRKLLGNLSMKTYAMIGGVVLLLIIIMILRR